MVSSTIVGSLAQDGSILVAVITYGVTILISLACVLWYRRVFLQEKKTAEAQTQPQKEQEHV